MSAVSLLDFCCLSLPTRLTEGGTVLCEFSLPPTGYTALPSAGFQTGLPGQSVAVPGVLSNKILSGLGSLPLLELWHLALEWRLAIW